MKLSRILLSIPAWSCLLAPRTGEAKTHSAPESSTQLHAPTPSMMSTDKQSRLLAEGEEPQEGTQEHAGSAVIPSPDDFIGDKDNHQPILFERKQLVLFAGPHKSASTSVEEFMAEWASNGFRRGHPHTKSLGFWRWPRVQGTYGTHGTKVFGRLITEPNNDVLHRTILDAISDTMEQAESGLIVGTEEFDQVGKDAIYEAIPSMKKVIRHLSIANDDVTIVLNYRSPRLDQWVSIWKHEESTSTYEDFLCMSHNDPEEKKRRLDMLGAQMNPLGAARVFLEEGWKVRLIDMGGVEKEGRDVSHVIGCRVLLGGCKDGFLGNLGDELPRENAVEKPFDEVDDEESGKMEELFRNRDCGYQAILKKYVTSGKLQIEYQESLWSTCDKSRKSYYGDLVGATDVLFAAFLSQLKCKDNPHNLRDGVTMDQALGRNNTIGHVFNGFVEVVLIPLVFLGGIGYVMLMMFKGKQQERLDKRAAAVAQAEMTAYPSSAFQDKHDDEEEVESDDDDDDDHDHDRAEEVNHDAPSN